MRKKLLFSVLSCTLGLGLNAQIIPNGGFENWSPVNYENVAGADFTQHIKQSGDKVEGQYAVKLENVTDQGNVDVGVVLFGHAGNNGISGGVPYSGSPDSLVFYAKYNVSAGDSALVIVFFYDADVPSQNMFFIDGSSNSFKRFSFPMNHGGNVDSIALAFTSGNFMSNPVAGSWIILDDAMFVGANATQLSNTNFENWNTSGYEDLDSWMTKNSGRYKDHKQSTAEKSMDAHSGTYALKLTADVIIDQQWGARNEGSISNYYGVQNGSIGGFTFHNTVDTLVGWYKYSQVGTDTANIRLAYVGNGVNGQGANINLLPVNSYTYFEIPINTGGTPDTLQIDIDATKYPYNQGNSGSVLYLDDLALKSDLTTGISSVTTNNGVSVYPNPVQDMVSVKFSSTENQTVTLAIYSIEGKLLSSKTFGAVNGNNQISMSTLDLSKGIYQYVLKGNDSILSTGQLVK